ncbi:hypothetical protein TNCV_4178921 [Trichonephila clavipes]|nr:hypothetical protein TNCV_4178921 [Trichonephila clavipes]
MLYLISTLKFILQSTKPANSNQSSTRLTSHSKPGSRSGENHLRKLWQRMQYPPLKAEVNRLQRVIRNDLRKIKEHVWDSLQEDANIDVYSLHKLVAANSSKNNILNPSPCLVSEAWFTGQKKKPSFRRQPRGVIH